MTNGKAIAAATAVFLAGFAATSAQADSCSHRNHTTGTVIGAVGGGVVGSAVSHGSLGGVVAGAALGGLAGNAIARDSDCRHSYRDRHYRRHAHLERRLASH